MTAYEIARHTPALEQTYPAEAPGPEVAPPDPPASCIEAGAPQVSP